MRNAMLVFVLGSSARAWEPPPCPPEPVTYELVEVLVDGERVSDDEASHWRAEFDFAPEPEPDKELPAGVDGPLVLRFAGSEAVERR